MAATSRAVSVGTTATRLDATADTSDDVRHQSSAIYNNGSATVFLGGADVTTANGFPLAAGTSMSISDLELGDELYGRVASGTVEVRVFEVGV